MTIHFIGAGPGAPDLITVRGRDLVMRCPVCLFAGSLVPLEIVALLLTAAMIGAVIIAMRDKEPKMENLEPQRRADAEKEESLRASAPPR